MIERTITRNGKSAVARLPESSDVDAVAVGGLAPDCFGKWKLVTRIFSYTPGKVVHYYAALVDGQDTVANGCGCSNYMKAGELMRTTALTFLLDSAECDALEAEMRAMPPAPAVFAFRQPAFGPLPGFDCYTLTADIGVHPVRSTVSRKTLEDLGYAVPARQEAA